GYTLTEKGDKEAGKVLRAHRLWETYLDAIGTPQEELHAAAHHLEHIREDGTVEYLDERLGKPERDPHGQSIPDKKAD
ncbi:MAG: metal ABC transporter permease, partial [Proteobacteria bacterium]|nr:metal ABC transporter permease [Pseudomonadota bacterium]